MAKGEHRSLVEQALKGTSAHAPAAFFLHFPSSAHAGPEAIALHAEYFRAVGMDVSKVQLELPFPRFAVEKPSDWARLPAMDDEFFAPQLEVVAGVVKELGPDAPVIVTLYSPYMCASDTGGEAKLIEHIQSEPAAVDDALAKIAERLAWFVSECASRGADGMYHSTQGAEQRRFADLSTFVDHVKPHDLVPMREAERLMPMNVLHICDYHAAKFGGYGDFTPFRDYPGQVISCNPEHLGPRGISEFFGRPFLGGMDRLGALAKGPVEAVRAAAREALREMPEGFILGANCTVPGDTPWDQLKAAVDEAHAWSRSEAPA